MRKKQRKEKDAEKEEGAGNYDFRFQLHKSLQGYEEINQHLRILAL